MRQKHTIKIDKKIVKSIFIGVLLGWITVFMAEHYSKVSYVADTYAIEKQQKIDKQKFYHGLDSNDPLAIANRKLDSIKESRNQFAFTSYEIPKDAPLLNIYMDTPFDSKLTISGKGYVVKDVWSSYGKFHNYSNQFKHYLKATFKDYRYVVYFGLGYAILIMFFTKFKFRFT